MDPRRLTLPWHLPVFLICGCLGGSFPAVIILKLLDTSEETLTATAMALLAVGWFGMVCYGAVGSLWLTEEAERRARKRRGDRNA